MVQKSARNDLLSHDGVPHLEPMTPSASQRELARIKTRREQLTHLMRILTAPAVVFGCSFALALQFALLTPLSIRLGVSRREASIVWLMGPVTGLVVQPLVGQLSDNFHRKHATRLPIVYVSATLLIVSHIGVAVAPSLNPQSSLSPLAVLIAAFWLFDACINAIVVTTRAMLSDRFCNNDRTFAFAVLQFWTSMGYLLGYLSASSAEGQTLESSVAKNFMLSAVVVVGGTVFSALSVRDKRACRMRFHTMNTGKQISFNLACLLSIVAGSVLTWFGWFAQQIYQSEFVSSAVQVHDLAESVRLASFGLVISSALSCITGLVLIPLILSLTGSDSITLFRVWSISSLLQGIDLATSPLVRTSAGAVLWEASTGPMYAVALSVPYMIMANGCDHGSTGRVMAFVNIAVCLPQLIVSLTGGIIVSLTGGNYDILFGIGALLCFVAGYLLWVPMGDEVPPWSVKSARLSLIASTSDWFSPGAARPIPEEETLQAPFLPPLPVDQAFEVRLRGLSTPHLSSVISPRNVILSP